MQSNKSENLTLEEKKKLLLQLVEKNKAADTASWPLSVGQQALWFLYQGHPSGISYNTGFALHIRSAVRPEAMRQAVQHLFSRHPLLSAVFTVKNGVPVCKPSSGMAHFETVDATSLNEMELYTAVVNKYQQPFELTAGPVARCYLFTRSQEEHVFLFSVHHIVYDDGSTPVVLRDLICRYLEACGQARDICSKELPKSFYDYVLSEKIMLTSERGNEACRFWLEQLRQVTALPPLQAYRNLRGTSREKEGQTINFNIEGDFYKKLKERAAQNGFTPFVWLLSAFQLLVHTYTGSNDTLVGIPASVRNITYKDCVGYFVNLLPVKGLFADKKDFLACLQACALAIGKGLQYKDYPFARMVEQAGTERIAGRHPLFQIAFNYLNHTDLFDEEMQLFLQSAGLSVSEYVVPTQESAFDITFELKDNYQSIAATCKFNKDLYEASFAALLCRHYVFCLKQSLEDPEQELRNMDWMLPEEKELLKACNDTAHQQHEALLIHTVFAGVATSYPQQVAVVAPDARLTYRELDEDSSRLAHYIRSKLDGKERVVGLITKPGSLMITGILGIIKAGAAYLPVDPDFPESRIRMMLEQAGCRLVLYDDDRSMPASGFQDNIEAVNFQSQWPLLATFPMHSPDVSIQPDDPAYIMFTSGSTGQPKGVLGLHKGVVNLVKHTNYVNIEPDDNLMLVSNYVFDGSIFEIFGALLNGATLHVLPAQTLFSPPDLFAYIRRCHVNTAFFSTAFFNHLVDADPSFVGYFDTILFGGELVSAQHVRKALPYCKAKGVLKHAYGPTECTTYSLVYPIEDLDEDCGSIPVGKPLANVKVWVLDEHLNTLPAGAAGQLYIGGMGVSGGYINQPELTAARFIPAPWHAEETLYATGDVACWLPDGNIHFIGRRDNQVKVRGYRIELGEIEAALSKHAKVQAAVVLCSRPPEGAAVIAAFAQVADQEPDARELADFLGNHLPHYMIPHQFHFLPAFPLNENGKVDRKKLYQTVRQQQAGQQPSFEPPVTEVQKKLAGIWQEVLGKQAIGVHDNFFELGGHSLLATKIIFQVRDNLGVEVPISSLFMKPTIYAMSSIIEEQQELRVKAPEPELIRVPRQSLVKKSRQE